VQQRTEMHPEYSRLLKPQSSGCIQIAMRRDETLQCTSPDDRFTRFLVRDSVQTDKGIEAGTRV
jgi:hypothetical protein